jgi:peptidyl-prolyl cis-trans isomerase D
MGDANLSAFLTLGYSNTDGDQLQNYALQRYASLSIANDLRIPAPTDTELASFLKSLRAFAGKDGEFDPAVYARFKSSLKSNPRLSEPDVARVLKADFRMSRVQQLLAGPGYVQPADIRQQIARADTSWTLSVVSISYESFTPSIVPSEADLNKYFEDNIFRYEIQPHFSGSYVEFPMASYLGQVQVTNAEIKAFYDANPSRFPAVAKESTSKLETDAAFASVKGQVETALKIERARRMAQKVASDVTVASSKSRLLPLPLKRSSPNAA